MSTFRRGDRVIATRDLGRGLTADAYKGDEGEVIRVDHSGWSGDSYTVRFDRGRIIDDLEENDLYRA